MHAWIFLVVEKADDVDEDVIKIRLEGTIDGWASQQIWRFEYIKSGRYHTRRAIITNRDGQAKVKMVYSWQIKAWLCLLSSMSNFKLALACSTSR